MESLVYRRYLVRYIDDNPVEAGITAKGEDYPFGSAYWYSRQKAPQWLSRDWVESEIGDAFGEPLSYARYQELFPTRLSGDEREWVETRLARGACSPDPLDMLTSASCDEIEGWLLEDEDSLRSPLVPPSLVTSGAERCRGVVRLGSIPFSSTRFSVWDVLGAGLLRQVSALSLAEISQRFGCSVTTARELVEHHRRLLRDESCYSAMAAEIVQEAMRTLFT